MYGADEESLQGWHSVGQSPRNPPIGDRRVQSGPGGGGAGTSVLQPGASDEKLFSAFSTGVTSEKDYELANSLAEGRRLEANMAHVEQASAHMGGVLERLGSSRQLIVVKDDHLDIERSKSFV